MWLAYLVDNTEDSVILVDDKIIVFQCLGIMLHNTYITRFISSTAIVKINIRL